MPDISISREQHAYVEALREEIAEEVTYGHVRTRDAIQYLIDHHKEDGELDIEVDAEVEPDGGDAGAATPESAPGGTAPTTDTTSSADSGTQNTDGASVDDTVAALNNAGPGGNASGGPASQSQADNSGDNAVEGSTDTLPSASNSKVEEMMNLLDAHDDKWEEAGSADARYRVELPDGDTETAQTKDDVRALLFKHY